VICAFDLGGYSLTGFHVGFFVTSFVLPVILIILMYIIMLMRLWRSVTYRVSKEGLQSKKRVTKLVLAIILVFTVCWAPIQVVLVQKSFSQREWSHDYTKVVIQIVAHVLAYTNSCLNPILYAKMSRNFRCGFCQMLPILSQRSSLRRPSLLTYEMTTRRRRRKDEEEQAEAKAAANAAKSVGGNIASNISPVTNITTSSNLATSVNNLNCSPANEGASPINGNCNSVERAANYVSSSPSK